MTKTKGAFATVLYRSDPRWFTLILGMSPRWTNATLQSQSTVACTSRPLNEKFRVEGREEISCFKNPTETVLLDVQWEGGHGRNSLEIPAAPIAIRHGTSHEEILKHSPPLADAYALNSAGGLDRVINELLRKLRPEESPLIVAREFLISRGVTPPVVTDEWWLDVVEFKEGELRFPDLNADHQWIFPLPFGPNESGKERGLNIAWTALQLDWMTEATEQRYCQLTHPARLHEYLRKWPGLLECGRTNASVLALYAPQLHDPFACLIWLLTDEADWLPKIHRERLQNGLRMSTLRWTNFSKIVDFGSAFRSALWSRKKSTFQFTRGIRADLEGLVAAALIDLGISENAETISRRFIEGEFVEGYYDQQERIREHKKQIKKATHVRVGGAKRDR